MFWMFLFFISSIISICRKPCAQPRLLRSYICNMSIITMTI
nr:MAG TPA: hypothetical protein [Caudoviricetes sp.]DAQ90485.1 MAG TPA: hypothetical protein [Caudoviricetes sp.]